MKKLIDEYIETIKSGETYYTYCTLWDDPENENVEFPNDRVGVGRSKKESYDKFMEHKTKRQELLKNLQAWQKGLREREKSNERVND